VRCVRNLTVYVVISDCWCQCVNVISTPEPPFHKTDINAAVCLYVEL